MHSRPNFPIHYYCISCKNSIPRILIKMYSIVPYIIKSTLISLILPCDMDKVALTFRWRLSEGPSPPGSATHVDHSPQELPSTELQTCVCIALSFSSGGQQQHTQNHDWKQKRSHVSGFVLCNWGKGWFLKSWVLAADSNFFLSGWWSALSFWFFDSCETSCRCLIYRLLVVCFTLVMLTSFSHHVSFFHHLP